VTPLHDGSFVFKTGSHYVAQAGLEHTEVFLLLLPTYWYYRLSSGIFVFEWWWWGLNSGLCAY
jgi:hypothetical protein